MITSELSKQQLMVQAIVELRQWSAEHLPIDNSLIAYDLMLLLSIHTYANSRITVKQLFASLPHSATAVRHHYQRFVDEGWIEHWPDPKDKRIKNIQATQKFVEMINAYTQATNDIMTMK